MIINPALLIYVFISVAPLRVLLPSHFMCVDDLAVFSSNEQLLHHTKCCLMNRFAIKDLGEILRYLGLEIERTDTRFTYHVAPYIAELVAHYLPDALSPADPRIKLSTRACPAPDSE
jgi:hypothetical protein